MAVQGLLLLSKSPKKMTGFGVGVNVGVSVGVGVAVGVAVSVSVGVDVASGLSWVGSFDQDQAAQEML